MSRLIWRISTKAIPLPRIYWIFMAAASTNVPTAKAFCPAPEPPGADGLYLFDEPEAALSPLRQMAMLSRLHQLAEEGCQFIIATHSPILLAYPHSRIYQLDETGIRAISYEESAPFQLTRRFLNDYRRMTAELLDAPGE